MTAPKITKTSNGSKLRTPQAEISPGFLRPPVAAKYLSISSRTLRRWTDAGSIPVIRMGRHLVLYSRAELDKALLKFQTSVAEPLP